MWWIESFPIMSLYVERKLWYIQRKRRKRERSEYIEKLKALWIERKHLFSFLHSIIIAVGTKTDASYPLHIFTRSCTFVHSNILILYLTKNNSIDLGITYGSKLSHADILTLQQPSWMKFLLLYYNEILCFSSAFSVKFLTQIHFLTR